MGKVARPRIVTKDALDTEGLPDQVQIALGVSSNPYQRDPNEIGAFWPAVEPEGRTNLPSGWVLRHNWRDERMRFLRRPSP